MSQEPDWIAVSQCDIKGVFEGARHGLLLNVEFSPYDIPIAVAGSYDQSSEEFRIEFRYINQDEKTKDQQQGEHVSLILGRKTDRLFGIIIKVVKMGVDAIGLTSTTAEETIDALVEASDDKSYYAAAGAIEGHKTDIFRPLEHIAG